MNEDDMANAGGASLSKSGSSASVGTKMSSPKPPRAPSMRGLTPEQARRVQTVLDAVKAGKASPDMIRKARSATIADARKKIAIERQVRTRYNRQFSDRPAIMKPGGRHQEAEAVRKARSEVRVFNEALRRLG